jgi:hypothetical protein
MKKNAAGAGLTLLVISALCYGQFARDTSGGTPDEKIIQNNSAGDSLRTQAQGTADSLRAQAQGAADSLRANQKSTADSLRAKAQSKATLLRAKAQGTADSVLSNERGTAKSLLTKEQGTADSMLSKEQGTAQILRANAQGTADTLRSNQQGTAKSLRANAQGTADSLLSNEQSTADSLKAQSQGAADTLRANEQGTAKSLRVNEQSTAKSLQGTAQSAADTLRASEQGTAKSLRANERGTADSLRVNQRGIADSVKAMSELSIKQLQTKSKDSTRFDVFGDLLKDDSAYSRKRPLWIPLVEVPAGDLITWSLDRFVAKTDFALNTWDTLKFKLKGEWWQWDFDKFGMGFWAHPYSGSISYLDARSNGYNFWESYLFSGEGSILWEYFGENTPPTPNDLLSTSINGPFYGEILYRLSSNILDDRTIGTERFFREFGAAVLSPTRFFNRLIQGKLTTVTDTEVYQKAPLNIELAAGFRRENYGARFGSDTVQNFLLNMQLDYGYPFETRDWKPFDYFSVRADINLGAEKKILDNAIGQGILFGKNVQYGDNVKMLLGIFQHYDYFDNTTFELGTIAFGAGIMTQYTIAKSTYLFTTLHVAGIPLAENTTQTGPSDTSQVRDFNYGDGMETKFKCGLNFGWGCVEIPLYYYWINTYVGLSGLNRGENYIGIIRPRITVRLYHNLNLGAEEMVYLTDRFTSIGDFHADRTEQRVYLMLNVGNFKL